MFTLNNNLFQKRNLKDELLINVCYVLMSVLFILRTIPYFSQAGDQTWFASQAIKYNYNYLQFGIDRYFNWSSRLLIESATMFFSVYQTLFVVFIFLLLVVFWKALANIFLSDNSFAMKMSIPIIFMILFTGNFYSGAGVIPNMVNYFLPMCSLILAWNFINKDIKIYRIASFLFIIFTCMQEQFAIFSFAMFLYFTVEHFMTRKKINICYFSALLISVLGLLSVIFSPGNSSRKIAETMTHYPTFNSISTLNKLYDGFMETSRVLFLDNTELNFIFLLLIVILVVSIIKKEYLTILMISGILYCTLFHHLGIDTPLNTIQKIVDENPNLVLFSKNYQLALYPVTLYFLFLLIIGFSIFRIFTNFKTGIFVLFIVVTGYLSRLAISFSPTIYVSGIRTFEPLIFASFIAILFMINELSVFFKLSNLERGKK